MSKPGQGILKHLRESGRGIDLPLDALREFQEFEKALDAGLKAYEGRDPAITYAMQSFTKVELLGLALMMEDEFPAVSRAHDDVMKHFEKDSAFDDGITLMSWLLFDFPTIRDGVPLAREVLNRTTALAEEIGPFVEAALRSRLGLYEVLKNGRGQGHLKELFTGSTLVLDQTLGSMRRGSVTLCRIMTISGNQLVFGHASEFPAAKRATIRDMVDDKMRIYFPDDSDVESYETMMRIAGPYWFSIVAQDYRGDILNPDHHLPYYRS